MSLMKPYVRKTIVTEFASQANGKPRLKTLVSYVLVGGRFAQPTSIGEDVALSLIDAGLELRKVELVSRFSPVGDHDAAAGHFENWQKWLSEKKEIS